MRAVRFLAATVLVAFGWALPAGSGSVAQAASTARVRVTPGTADPSYATTLTLSGSGFQAIKGGHGGIYVFFGTVDARWRPSQGGQTGRDYFYVPDAESADNAGFQKFVSFDGGDTEASANGGVIRADGTWHTTLVVPGAVFTAADRNGDPHQVDCRTVRCGVITIGAHGVTNTHNETFTPVAFASSPSSTPSNRPSGAPSLPSGSSSQPAGTSSPPSGTTASAARTPAPAGPATLTVDRGSAVAGHVMPFTATGLTPGLQVSVVLDDGIAAAGPLQVGATGQLAGLLTLPAKVDSGTHELRLVGTTPAPSVRFAIAGAVTPVTSVTSAAGAAQPRDDRGTPGLLFALGSVAVLALVAIRLLVARGLLRTGPRRRDA